MGDSNGHAYRSAAHGAVGGGAGKGHRHVELPKRTPIGNLWRTVAEKFGLPYGTFGDSTGKTDVLV